jgi:hypothetical protein
MRFKKIQSKISILSITGSYDRRDIRVLENWVSELTIKASHLKNLESENIPTLTYELGYFEEYTKNYLLIANSISFDLRKKKGITMDLTF